MGAGFSAGMGIAKSFEREGVTDKTVFGVMEMCIRDSGRNADALLSKNLLRKIPLPQSLFAQKALCQKPFGSLSPRAVSYTHLLDEAIDIMAEVLVKHE